MKKRFTLLLPIFFVIIASTAFKKNENPGTYLDCYDSRTEELKSKLNELLNCIKRNDPAESVNRPMIRARINSARTVLKNLDFWFRYLEPLNYKKINGPLPVEWETEVFEKFEPPYKREGAGLTLAKIYLDEENPEQDSLITLVKLALKASEIYRGDSLRSKLTTADHFYFCNRLFLLNLAAIYTTGFECPDSSKIIPELKSMLLKTREIYKSFNSSFPEQALPKDYLALFDQTVSFAEEQSGVYLDFDHFTFIKDFVNPLFAMNQKMIRENVVVSKSYVDYSLNNAANSIFSKRLYRAQNAKGIFLRVYDQKVLNEIAELGKMLYYDPLLSGNNQRSCASCHIPEQYFTDTSSSSALQFDRKERLTRNAPSLVNVEFNHLIMHDGRHLSLQDQAKDVIKNDKEMACAEPDILFKVMSCSDYKKRLKRLVKQTPQQPRITIDHITSAITYYYSKFSNYISPFDKAMNRSGNLNEDAVSGFNLFMGKAQCGTCHFVPQFNGVKPPYVSSEFEVLGVPADSNYKQLSNDRGRFLINPAFETENAFRTGSVRNAEKTKPYMHNGVFKDLHQVIDFYNAGGGSGKGLKVKNQTLSGDSLHLNTTEKKQLLAFVISLNEEILFETPPKALPHSKIKALNNRKVGGEY